jgi:hypothetical protein
MNLQEQISRIQSMMGFINEDKKTDLIYKNFDNVFDNLKLIKTEKDIHQYNWVDSNDTLIFERNHWGVFWIYGCDEYEYLNLVPRKMMRFSYEEFEKILINYLNNRYSKEFGEERPLRNIGNENCLEIEDY